MAPMNVQEMFAATAANQAGRPAVERDGRVTTYGELREQSERLAGLLRDLGAGPGDVVGLLLSGPPELAAAMLATLARRALFVPLDPMLPDRRLAAMLAGVRPRFLVTAPELEDRLRTLTREGEAAATVVVMAGDVATVVASAAGGASGTAAGAAPPAAAPPAMAQLPAEPDDPCYVFFTSGSAGAPKGILGRAKGIDHFVRWEIETLGVRPGMRFSQLTSPGFDAVLRDLFTPLCAGGVVCVPPHRDVLRDPRRLAAWLAAERVEVLHCVPSLLRALLAQELPQGGLPALSWVLVAGEPLLPADVGRFCDALGEGARLVNLYGPSETTMTKFVYFVTPTDRELATIPIGKPMPGAAALVFDASDRPCPAGQVGEIVIRTAYRSHGYWQQPELTERAFVPNPVGKDPADRLYRTGDLGRVVADGNFIFVGRSDQQLKIRGVRIEPAEVEGLLLRHPAVLEAAVAAHLREADPVLCAYLVLREPVEAGAMRELLAADLPEAMIPSHFITVAELPRTVNGKLDRRALPPPAASAAADLAAPRTATEELVAGIFQSVLGVERIGIRESFFERGGHSLLAIQVLAQIQKSCAVEMPLASIFESPTVAGLAAMVDQAQALAGGPPIPEPVRRGRTEAPLSFSQQRLWFMDQLQPGSSFYNVATAVILEGALDAATLRWALGEVVRRQESLRTVFAMGAAGEPRQIVRPVRPVPLPLVDLRGLAAANAETTEITEIAVLAAARAIAERQAAQPFDLAAGPLLRCTLLRLGATRHALAFTHHHIVGDGLSSEILLYELAGLYRSRVEGRPSPLAELPLQYTDFALWQREGLRGEVLAAQLAYWRRQLAGAPPVHHLPADRPRPAVKSFRGGRQSCVLSTALTTRVRELAQREGCTLFMTFLACFQTLLHLLSGDTDIVVGSPINYRSWPELRPLIGTIVNTLLFRTAIAGDPRFREVLAAVRETALAAFAHQSVPFEKLVEELQPERTLSHNPLFQLGFTFNGLQGDPTGQSLGVQSTSLTVLPFEFVTETAQFDLNLILTEGPTVIEGVFQFSRDLFDDATVAGVEEQFLALCERIVASPDQRLSELRELLAQVRLAARRRVEEEIEQAGRSGVRSRRRRSVVGASAAALPTDPPLG